jgi:hypothetical protein
MEKCSIIVFATLMFWINLGMLEKIIWETDVRNYHLVCMNKVNMLNL